MRNVSILLRVILEQKLGHRWIHHFLEQIPSIPKVLENTDSMTFPIHHSEVEAAIKQLCPGKSPGSDGITANFYKHFVDKISLILSTVFNDIFKVKSLSASQCLAIIILLFKRGKQELLMNYWPISLTNTDYKILAYILTNHLQPHLSALISSQQTAYMKG